VQVLLQVSPAVPPTFFRPSAFLLAPIAGDVSWGPGFVACAVVGVLRILKLQYNNFQLTKARRQSPSTPPWQSAKTRPDQGETNEPATTRTWSQEQMVVVALS